MSEPKTKPNNSSVTDFINSIEGAQKKQDCMRLTSIFVEQTNEKPRMWGDSIVGFGQYHYKSDRSGQEGDWMLTGFSPRKQNLTIYILNGFADYQDLLSRLGKHKTSVSCLYLNKLSDIDLSVLAELIAHSYASMKNIHNIN